MTGGLPLHVSLKTKCTMSGNELYQTITEILRSSQDGGETKGWQWAHRDTTDVTNFDQLIPKTERPIDYDFSLDTFQKRACLNIWNGQHVFVSAHTSAGKTITAEWAIAMALSKGRRAVYTSPIKALSNQKFRDFRVKFNHIDVDEFYNDPYDDCYDDFDDFGGGGGGLYDFSCGRGTGGGASDEEERVGIITGDIQLHQEAPCLIMTTEILRTMIYDNDKALQEIDWVVFDEIHYMNDPERGRVWEEVIALLPSNINMLFLSATTPNSMEFSEWVGRVKQRRVAVVSTPKRPIPLEHYLHVGTQDKDLVGYYKDQEELRADYLDTLDTTADDFSERLEEAKRMKFKTTRLRDDIPLELSESDGMFRLVDQDGTFDEAALKSVNRICLDRQSGNLRRSAISFKQAKHHWIQLFRLLRIKQRFPVVVFVFSKRRCEALTEHLSAEDYTNKREKSRIKVFINQCLQRLPETDRELPQIRMVVELLIRGIAVHHGGLLPILKEMTEILFARSFIRVLFATETFAMGINMPTRSVIFSGVSKHDGYDFRNLLPGEYTQMSGRAGRRGLDKVGTVMVVNWKLEHTDYKRMISGKPLQLVSKFHLTYQTILSMFHRSSLDQTVTGLLRNSFSEFNNSRDAKQVFRINRVVAQAKGHNRQLLSGASESVSAGCKIWKSIEQAGKTMYGCLDDLCQPGNFRVWFRPGRIVLVSPETGIYPSVMQLTRVNKQELWGSYVTEGGSLEGADMAVDFSWIIAFCEEIPSQGNVKFFRPKRKQGSLRFDTVCQLDIVQDLVASVYQTPTLKLDDQEASLVREGVWLETKITQMEHMASEETLELFPDYTGKVNVLRSLGYLNADEVLTLKGRVATRMNTAHELVLTEFVLDNGLDGLNLAGVAALLSCCIANECPSSGSDFGEIAQLDSVLETKVKLLETGLVRVMDAQTDHGVKFDPERFRKTYFNPALVVAVYQWVEGETFAEIMKTTEAMEGTIVRAIMRLDELCQELGRASAVIGDPGIEQLMTQVSDRLRRDIVWCGSLYV